MVGATSGRSSSRSCSCSLQDSPLRLFVGRRHVSISATRVGAENVIRTVDQVFRSAGLTSMEKGMKESNIEGVAIHGGTESCVDVREGGGKR